MKQGSPEGALRAAQNVWQHNVKHFLPLLFLLLLLSLPAVAQEAKWHKISNALQQAAFTPVTAQEVDQAALQEINKHCAATTLQQAWRAHPDQPLMEWSIQGVSRLLNDPYLTYLDPEAFECTLNKFQGEAQPGPGFSIVKDGVDQPVHVLEVEPDGPNQIHAGDVILALDGQLTANMPVETARAHMEGSEGSSLKVQTVDAVLDLVRHVPDPRTVYSEVLPSGVAYLRIRNFAATTPSEVEQALSRFPTQNLLLDLRNNGGGLVNAAVQVCASFLPSSTPVVLLQRRNESQPYVTQEAHPPARKLVVLINHESASAAEIVASALHDAGLAQLVGTTSFGKGCVQRYLPLGDGSGLKFTCALYQTPAGRWIQGSGIVPDVTEERDPIQRAQHLLIGATP